MWYIIVSRLVGVARGAKGAMTPQTFKVCYSKWSLLLKNTEILVNYNQTFGPPQNIFSGYLTE